MNDLCECSHGKGLHTAHECRGSHLRTDHDVIERTECTCVEYHPIETEVFLPEANMDQ